MVEVHGSIVTDLTGSRCGLTQTLTFVVKVDSCLVIMQRSGKLQRSVLNFNSRFRDFDLFQAAFF
jgi:hypothetical protein